MKNPSIPVAVYPYNPRVTVAWRTAQELTPLLSFSPTSRPPLLYSHNSLIPIRKNKSLSSSVSSIALTILQKFEQVLVFLRY